MDRLFAFKMLMTRRSLEGLSDEAALRHIDRLAQAAVSAHRPEGLRLAITLAEELSRRTLRPVEIASVHYTLAEAWEKLRLISRTPVEAWEQEEIERELYHLRRSMPREALRDIPRERLCQTLSNMAALLNHVGRFSEAIEYWDRALSVLPSFAIARGKKGYALTHYAQALYDKSQSVAFLRCAHAELGTALSLGGLYPDARSYFSARKGWIEGRLSPDELRDELDLAPYTDACTEEEVLYRRWCLESRLFLNPMNDLGPFPLAARDTLHMTPIASTTYYQGFFNQMKQAYVSARYLYYEGLNAEGPHFSDRHVLLFDTQDCASYSLSIEKIKASYRIAYGLTGKIARFLNLYLSLGIPEGRITFRTLWYNSQHRPGGLRPEFAGRKNWPMRGLFWLSKDLYEDIPELGEPIEPEGRDLMEILYQMDHRYLKLLDTMRPGFGQDTVLPQLALEDQMAYSMRRGDFEAKTLRVLKMVRSALTYLSLAIHMEERAKKFGNQDLPAIRLELIEDEMKI